MPTSTGRNWLSADQAALELGVVKRTLYRFIDEGDLPGYKFGRVIRLQRDDVEEFISRSQIKPGELSHLWR